jgi:hypothetical protein
VEYYTENRGEVLRRRCKLRKEKRNMSHPLDLRVRRIQLKGEAVTTDTIKKALIPAVLPAEREARVQEETITQGRTAGSKSPCLRLDIPLSAMVRVLVDLDPNEQCILVKPVEPRWFNWLGPVKIILFGASFPQLSRAVNAVAHALKQRLSLLQPVQMLRMPGSRGPEVADCECNVCSGKAEK